MTRDVLIEIGAEELPASFVTHALASMKAAIEKLLTDARLAPGGEVRTYGTPRRLAVFVSGVPDAQPDRRDTVMGPPASAAVKPDGSFGPAAEGFARKNGVPVSALRVVETAKGAYVAVDVEEAGRPAHAVLPELFASVCERITFPKAMRWGEGDVAFGRPIHWIVALHGAEVVSFRFAGVESGRSTRGHRFLAPDMFELPDAGCYLDALRRARVLADMDERRAVMRERLVAAATALGGVLEEDAFLMDECQSLVEEPQVVPGTIDARFLDLPDDVIVSVMRTHQRYFAVRTIDGTLVPRYLNVVNTAESPETIAKGNDRVLRARLNDAAFFVREDRKKGFEPAPRLEVLDRVVFQHKLGSVGAKVGRISQNSRRMCPEGVDVADLAAAVQRVKLDLTTYIVGEFPELQGNMGRFYALESGVKPNVADAIREHYRPAGAGDGLPSSSLASVIAVADRLDTLVGCFGIGLVPSGSADPFALRRAAIGVLRIATEGQLDVDLARELPAFVGVLRSALPGAFAEDKEPALLAQLEDFFRGRLRAYYRERFPGDVVDAALSAWPLGSLRDLDARIKAVDAFRSDPAYAALATAFKRAFNIAKDVLPGTVDPALLEDGAERTLADAFERLRGPLEQTVAARDYRVGLARIGSELGTPIDRFFEQVFVMVEDASLRGNRLLLLRSIADSVRRIVHFDQLTP